MAKAKKAKRDIRQEVTDKIVEALESGTAPWVKPWTGNALDGAPHNLSGHVYRGINVLLLTLAQMNRGYATSQWMTYNQAKKEGGQVRKGERSTTVVLYKIIPLKDEDGEDTGLTIPIMRHFAVFNRDQVDGLPPVEVVEVPEVERHESAEEVIANTGAKISHGGDRAFYSPSADAVRLPNPESFDNVEEYYATAFHELGHWTGHKSRLDRQIRNVHGSKEYALEELIAELTSAFLCVENNVEGRLQHPEYIAGWIKVLKDDKRAIFTASSKARKAADFVAGVAN